jgi:hypothetical protein
LKKAKVIVNEENNTTGNKLMVEIALICEIMCLIFLKINPSGFLKLSK